MKAMEFTEFQAVCYEQDVVLHDNIADLRPPEEKTNYNCYAPTSMMKAIVVAGRILSTGRQALADRPIDTGAFTSEDTVASALANIINTSIDSGIQPLYEVPNFNRVSYPGIWACQLAEPRFIKTYEDLSRGHGQCQIVGSDEATPLFIRKNDVQPSALSLDYVQVDGVEYAPGSLFLLELLTDTPNQKNRHRKLSRCRIVHRGTGSRSDIYALNYSSN